MIAAAPAGHQTTGQHRAWATLGIRTLFLGFLFSAPMVYASAWPTTPADFATLPPYCKARLKPSSETETQVWSQRLGTGFLHVHHYCAALHTEKLCFRAKTSADRKACLRDAIKEIEYVEDHASPDFIL